MANSPANTNRLYDGGKTFALGINSFLHPRDIPKNQCCWGINLLFKGAIPYTRPSFNSLLRMPDGRAQGFTLFTPKNGAPTMIIAVSGLIYVSPFPFTSYTQLSSIKFNSGVDHIVFKECLQGADNGTPIPPKPVLIMQDGISKPAYYDGSAARHLNPGGTTQETVMGLPMEWVGSRLWVARENELFASDIFDPLHFTETIYLGSGGSFQAMDGAVIRALKRTADQESLLVFTIGNTSLVQAGITNRNSWSTISNFVSYIFPGVGCCAVKSPCELNGNVWWMSIEGARNYAQVGATIRTSSNAISSVELDRSFRNISPSINRACGFGFAGVVGFSVPSGDLFNRHTWILDTAISSQLGNDQPPAWTGIWTGTRPVEWAAGKIAGKNRCFYLSQDRCGVRVWEAFGPEHQDNGARIFCSLETNGLNFGEPTSIKRFLFSEGYLDKVSGKVDFTYEYRGDWGCWKPLAQNTLCAKDCLDTPVCNQPLLSLAPQSRYFRTQEAQQACISKEGSYPENFGTFFQNRIRWYGKAGVQMFKSQAVQIQETSTGQCTPSDSDCKALLCCDQEPDYWSHVNDGGYGSGSSTEVLCSL